VTAFLFLLSLSFPHREAARNNTAVVRVDAGGEAMIFGGLRKTWEEISGSLLWEHVSK
jgi:hypothetical protein